METFRLITATLVIVAGVVLAVQLYRGNLGASRFRSQYSRTCADVRRARRRAVERQRQISTITAFLMRNGGGAA